MNFISWGAPSAFIMLPFEMRYTAFITLGDSHSAPLLFSLKPSDRHHHFVAGHTFLSNDRSTLFLKPPPTNRLERMEASSDLSQRASEWNGGRPTQLGPCWCVQNKWIPRPWFRLPSRLYILQLVSYLYNHFSSRLGRAFQHQHSDLSACSGSNFFHSTFL